jgi:hypothetical protein
MKSVLIPVSIETTKYSNRKIKFNPNNPRHITIACKFYGEKYKFIDVKTYCQNILTKHNDKHFVKPSTDGSVVDC